ncbi:response regulator [Aquimarina sp. AU474]|uniref:response regulator n=1 Tax=Aquimarina sp. AU474 TaxID=2108529 RepID=UPI000D69BECF|nr:response regulator [Aquimarina sp. AU474]
MDKIERILLVDDSNATNFYNKRIIQKTELVTEILTAKNGSEALDYLKAGIIPQMIFLDVNMPVMNGWEFIIEYQKLNEEYKRSIIILMLGTALDENDREFAENTSEIREFQDKILTKEIVCNMVTKYFDHVTSTMCS